MSAGMTLILWKRHAFGRETHFREVPGGLTIAEIVNSQPTLPSCFDDYGEVWIGDDRIPDDAWPRVSVKAHVSVVLAAPPRDGGGGDGGGGKNPLGTILAIAALAAGAAVTGGALAGLLGPAFAAGGAGATAAGAGVGLIGSLASSALTPPPSGGNTTPGFAGNDGGPGDRGQGIAALSGNVLRQQGPFPRVLGTHRLSPPQVCHPLIEPVGDDEYAEVVFGLAGPHSLTDIRVGIVPITDLTEVEIATYEALPGSAKPDLVNRQGFTETLGLEVSRHDVDPEAGTSLADQVIPSRSLPEWHAVKSKRDVDEFWINAQFPRGLFSTASINTRYSLPVRVRFRLVGSGTWRNAPEFHFKSRRTTGFQRLIKFSWATTPTSNPQPITEDAPDVALLNVPGQSLAPATAGWLADSYFDANTGGAEFMDATNHLTTDVRNVRLHADRIEFYLPAAEKGEYEFEIKFGHPFPDANLNHTTYMIGGTVYDFFAYYTSGAHRLLYDLTDLSYDPVVSRVMSIRNTHPVPTGDIAFIAVRIHNRQLAQLSVLAAGYINVWDGSTWETVAISANPAENVRHIYASNLGANAIPPDIIDDAGLLAWRAACVSKGYEVNAVAEGVSRADAALITASAGYARPRSAEVFGIMRDYDRSAEAPSQIFSPRNLGGFRFERAFADVPDGLRVTYRNKALDYDGDEIIVLDPRQTSGGSKLEAVSYSGLVTEAEVRARALFDLAQPYHRGNFYYGRAPWRAVMAERGDLVGVSHDIITRRSGFARIAAVSDDGGGPPLLTGLTLDATVPADLTGFFDNSGTEAFFDNSGPELFFLTPRMGAMIEGTDGTLFIKEVVPGTAKTTALTFVTPFEDASGVIVPGVHVVTGELGAETLRAILVGVMPKDDRSYDLTMIDEGPGLFS